MQTNDRRMFEMFETLNKALENAFVELFFPYIYNWIPGFTGWDHFLQHSKEVKELIFEAIHEHKKTRVVGRPRVFILTYIQYGPSMRVQKEAHRSPSQSTLRKPSPKDQVGLPSMP